MTKDRIDELLKGQAALQDRLEKMEAIEKAKEIEGRLENEREEPEGQMFTISRDVMDVVGEADALLTKTRFDSVREAEKAIEPFITRLYAKLERERLGGWGTFLPLEDIKNKKIDLREYQAFEINETPIKFQGKDCLEVYIELASVRARLLLKARISLGGGKSRQEAMHHKHGEIGGIKYLDSHAPAPPMYMEKYGKTQQVSKAEVAADVLMESGEDTRPSK